MSTAFLSFSEPHAWLIRGLVEYGWRDVTHLSGNVPAGAPGGFDVGVTVSTQGREALHLIVPPVAGRERADDPPYEFELRVTGHTPDIKVVARSTGCNFLQEFAWDPANPQHLAGYLHQAITEHVSRFVTWRNQGNDLSWTERNGLPDVKGDPCSPELVRFIANRLRRLDQNFNQGPAEGWWVGGAAQPWGPGPVAVSGQGGGDPTYISSQARAELAAMGGANASVERVRALDLVERPVGWLRGGIWMSMALGGIALLNIAVTAYLYGTGRMFAIAASATFAGSILLGGWVALRGAECYREVRTHWTVWFMLAYVAFVPVCCVIGMPLAIWGAVVWLKPEVQAGRIASA